MQQRSGLRTLLLEKKVQVLSETLEKKEAQIGEVLTASNLDPGTLQNVTKKLDDVLESKNQLIKALQYDLAKVSKVGGGYVYKARDSCIPSAVFEAVLE